MMTMSFVTSAQTGGPPGVTVPGVSTSNWINILIDGDMEAADVSDWTVVGGVLTKQTGTPHGGIRCLRVADSVSNGGAQQSVLESGKTYRVTGWYRVESGATAEVLLGAGNTVFSGTAETWTGFDVTAAAVGVEFRLVQKVNDLYAEFDDVSVYEVG